MAPTVLHTHPTPPLTASCELSVGADRWSARNLTLILLWQVSTLVDTMGT